jgi:hypothetical protein
MKKWETPVLSVLHRSTSAEKVLIICKSNLHWGPQPLGSYGRWCVQQVIPCIGCNTVNLS